MPRMVTPRDNICALQGLWGWFANCEYDRGSSPQPISSLHSLVHYSGNDQSNSASDLNLQVPAILHLSSQAWFEGSHFRILLSKLWPMWSTSSRSSQNYHRTTFKRVT